MEFWMIVVMYLVLAVPMIFLGDQFLVYLDKLLYKCDSLVYKYKVRYTYDYMKGIINWSVSIFGKYGTVVLCVLLWPVNMVHDVVSTLVICLLAYRKVKEARAIDAKER